MNSIDPQAWLSDILARIAAHPAHRRTNFKPHDHPHKVHHVTTITQVAKDLAEDEDWLREISIKMEIEDGVIWVYGVGENGVEAFTDFGIDNMIELIRFYKENPGLLKR